MMKKISLSLIAFFMLTLVFGQSQKFTISGYVEDAGSGEKLISVNIFDTKSNLGTITNTYGFYSITLPKDSVYLSVSYVGFKTQYLQLDLKSDQTLNIKLEPDLVLETVEVVADKYEPTIEETSQMSSIDVPIEQIKKIPALLGEVDVLKALQLLPGVQSGGEGQNGLYVRGGSPDQNLILLDGVPVYNASHLFGFFSVFNADAIKDVKLIKGGFPARYGGRLSSVIDINMKEGNLNEWHGTGTIGIVASKFTVEGPIKKDKTSVLLSARRTYIDVLARPFIKNGFESESGRSGDTGYFFHDINAKINHKFSEKDRLFLSTYTGLDKFYYNETFNETDSKWRTASDFKWGNVTAAARWNHLWTNKLFSNTTFTYSRYKFNTGIEDDSENTFSGEREVSEISFNYLSGIRDISGKIDFDFVPNPNHFIRFGASATYHQFEPGEFDLYSLDISGSDQSVLDTLLGSQDQFAGEYAVYVEDDLRVGDWLKMNIGLHASAFGVDNKLYTSLQPRFGSRFMLPNGVAIKASFATMRQYIQLLANENLGLPTDLWLPTTGRVKPQDSWQVALGAAKTIGAYEISVEGYYKEMKNVLSYKEGEGIFSLKDWQDRVTQGDGDAYGAEFFIQKKKGRLTGWLGYTLSWTNRQFDEINFGKKFPFKYDRRHDVSVVASYKLSEKIQLSAAWVFGTGNNVTIPTSKYSGFYPPTILRDGQDVSIEPASDLSYFASRNNYRMRAYHRLDFGIDFIKKKKRGTRVWNISTYNTYSRRNPFFITIEEESVFDSSGRFVRNEKKLKQINLFPLIPSVSYRFEF